MARWRCLERGIEDAEGPSGRLPGEGIFTTFCTSRGADQPVVRPHWSPFTSLLGHFGVCLLDQGASRESISPLQSPRSSILASISSDGDSALFDSLFFMLPASPWVRFSPCPATPLSLAGLVSRGPGTVRPRHSEEIPRSPRDEFAAVDDRGPRWTCFWVLEGRPARHSGYLCHRTRPSQRSWPPPAWYQLAAPQCRIAARALR